MNLQLIVEQIRGLSLSERKILLNVIVDSFLENPISQERPSLLDLEGLGREIWEGIDAQTYVDDLRSEWDHRP